jgi:hypothetical protein
MAQAKTNRVKGVASRRFCGRKLIWITLVGLLVIPAIQVGVVRFVDPPGTLPMCRVKRLRPRGFGLKSSEKARETHR